MSTPKSVETEIETLDQFIREVCVTRPCRHWIYRGVKDARFALLSTLGRLAAYKDAAEEHRQSIEQNFLLRSYSATRPIDPNYLNPINEAVSAQHHGAPTRLIDWTKSPLIAAYFACEPSVDATGCLSTSHRDVAVYAAHCCPDMCPPAEKLLSPEEAYGSIWFEPVVASPRVAVQQSVFVVPRLPEICLLKQPSASITEFHKYVIPKQRVREFQTHLHRLGITKRMLFPDADGLNSSLVTDAAIDDLLIDGCDTIP